MDPARAVVFLLQQKLQLGSHRSFGPAPLVPGALHGQTLRVSRGNELRSVPAGLELQLRTSGHGAEEEPAGAVVALRYQRQRSSVWDQHSEHQSGASWTAGG